MFFIPKILQEFKLAYPDVRISLLETLSLNDVEKALNNFDIHVAITNQYVQNEDITTLPIYDEKLVALLPKGHALESKSCLQLADFAQQDFIVCKEGFQTRNDIMSAFQKAGIPLQINCEIERFETCCSLVENNLGISIVPQNYVHYSNLPGCIAKPIQDIGLSRNVYIAYDKNRYLSPLVQCFITAVLAYFRSK
ncbi:LysR family transcriptional regulator substrate-binding protein [Virgibacillus halophilus]|uniref:LysR family transcriptional regulator substrate-binding protein n=2 Tax=Tigheibacillus halophilus TaxID=361280 RepID=A0ABU5C482_9BACI|nr:LysR family transcriptional regulator substrate-binding protein [Virgibacillus halophilus]